MTDPNALGIPDDVAPARPAPVAVSPRSRSVALVIGLLLGIFGGHRFYAGKVRSGVLQLCTLGGLGLWWLYDMILLAAGEFSDIEGRRIHHWGAGDAGAFPMAGERQWEQVMRELESLQGQVSELAERVDFAERLLAHQRERGRLP